MLFGFYDHQRSGLTEHEAVAVPVEWTAGTGRIVVGVRQHNAHLGEPGDGHSFNLGFHATADGDVSLAIDDIAPGIGDRLRT